MKLTTSLKNAARAALQWRLLLVWLGALLLPTLLLSLPLWSTLSSGFDRSVHVAELAQRLDVNAVTDLMAAFGRNKVSINAGGIAALVLTLLLSPFLTGAVVTVARAKHTPRFRELFAGGVAEYARMFRMLLWAVIPLGVAIAIGGGLSEAAEDAGAKAVLEADGALYGHLATAAMALLFALANATLDAGRAELAIDRRRTSAVKAWWRGVKLMLRRPGPVLGGYLLLTLGGLLVAGALAVLRLNIAGDSWLGFLAALLVTQLIALVIVWMRSARLLTLVGIAASNR